MVHFERIGRNHAVPDMPIAGDPNDGTSVADQVHVYARQHLGSSFYEAAVNEDTGEVLIESAPTCQRNAKGTPLRWSRCSR